MPENEIQEGGAETTVEKPNVTIRPAMIAEIGLEEMAEIVQEYIAVKGIAGFVGWSYVGEGDGVVFSWIFEMEPLPPIEKQGVGFNVKQISS